MFKDIEIFIEFQWFQGLIVASYLLLAKTFYYNFLLGHLSVFPKDCVKRRALMSVKNNPYCSEAASKDAIDAVWNICYNDTRPFDRAP